MTEPAAVTFDDVDLLARDVLGKSFHALTRDEVARLAAALPPRATYWRPALDQWDAHLRDQDADQ